MHSKLRVCCYLSLKPRSVTQELRLINRGYWRNPYRHKFVQRSKTIPTRKYSLRTGSSPLTNTLPCLSLIPIPTHYVLGFVRRLLQTALGECTVKWLQGKNVGFHSYESDTGHLQITHRLRRVWKGDQETTK